MPRVPPDFHRDEGHALLSLRHAEELVVQVVTLLAHGCPVQAIVAAFHLDERTVADWQQRAAAQCQQVHEHLVEQPRDLGEVQADELRVKQQRAVVWVALAMQTATRLWLGGTVSRQRDRRLIERVRRCARHLPLLLITDGFSAYATALRRVCREKVARVGRGRRLQTWVGVVLRTGRQTLPATARGRSLPESQVRRGGTSGDLAPQGARERCAQHGLHRTPQRDIPPTIDGAGASHARTGAAHDDHRAGDVVSGGTLYNF